VLGSLGVSIPLIAIAGHDPGLAGIALVCVAIVLVNLIVDISYAVINPRIRYS